MGGRGREVRASHQGSFLVHEGSTLGLVETTHEGSTLGLMETTQEGSTLGLVETTKGYSRKRIQYAVHTQGCAQSTLSVEDESSTPSKHVDRDGQ